MKLSVVIPVYNEINTFLEILRQVKAVPIDKEIIIIDDYSTDGTREILKDINEKNIQVFFNEKNMGKGFCIRKGFEHVTGDIVIIQDADLEYYPDEYPQLIKKIKTGKADVVYGTRFLGTHRVFHFYHFLGNKLLNLIANFLYNTNLSDLMTCYKAFRLDVVKRLNLHAHRFGIESEITAQILKLKLRLYEVPISYSGRDYDEGKKITWRDFFRSVYWLLRAKFQNLDVGETTLYRIKAMKNNNKWMFNEIKNYLGNNILEIGSGIGNISKFLTSTNKNLVLTDINKNYIEYLQHKFIGHPRVKILLHDILSPNLSNIMPHNIDTAICINVLEHIQDDNKALENIYKILSENGRLILIVPALKYLYGSLDTNLGHFNRYDKNKLIKQLQNTGFDIEKIYYHNMISVIGWFINSRILKTKVISKFQSKIFDKLIPFLKPMEKTIKIPFGLSLVVICKKSN